VTPDSQRPHVAFVSLGSNLGDKRKNCLDGLGRLLQNGHTVLIERSRFYRTAPVDYEDQDWFANAVAKVETRFDPHALLKQLLEIEADMGRRREGVPRFGPRIIDLDLIFYDARRIESGELVLPHPRMHKRRFVLQPICDIDPELLHPVLGQSMRELLADPDVSRQALERLRDD